MFNLATFLKNQFEIAIGQAFPDLEPISYIHLNEITPSTHDKFGHYQCNVAMKMGKMLKQNPRQVAEKIVEHLKTDHFIDRVEIAGPGFINMTLSASYLSQQVNLLLSENSVQAHQGKIIIDFSSPNIAKEMHVGHLRSTIIGDCLARVFEFLGYDVLRLNHLGDWGTSFGMLIAYIKQEAPEVVTGQQTTNLTHLVTWYKAAKKKFDEDPLFKKASQLEVVSLQQGDPDARHAWEIICTISREAYQHIYDLLDIKLIDRGESYYNPLLPTIVSDLEQKGLVQISDGAKCIFVEGFQNRDGTSLPLMIQKSDGGYTYDTTDIAALYQRLTEEKADRIVYVTDAGQSVHFQMVFKAAQEAGYWNPDQVRLDHVPFGLVLGADGKKFRTRSGETEKLIDLLKVAIEQADRILTEKNPSMTEEERKELAKALGIGAIKYADLACHRVSDYTFSYDRMLRFEGNTAAFLMYAYVRIAGIKRKINVNADNVKKQTFIQLEHPSEVALGLHLLQFNEALEQVTDDLLPNRLTDYLYTLAEKFNAFFRDCRVEGSPQQNERLLLCEVTASTLKQGLALLGVKTVDKM